MMLQTSKGKVPHIYKELIRRIVTKSTKNKVASNIVIQVTQIAYEVAFLDKAIDFPDEPVVQCDVQAVINTSLDNDDDDDRK